ncbi:UDP-Glycosyltransferase/glycogen phosphorylase [Dacryopinax primogenitus]|uniref:UDP-Glycosyltransferase/glycogen phosphorylase n=1 Tax=Dacryopinax primogenitus (strain DJM 731) TaxID=1858805 RepID=M5G5J8_DACPD|nr:UDP-Glycosyltransferase/glycogen phosphorylase [Dacryopinax primogenitus]EJU03974.1 UDP-Glycosyltransferase/glycogen phosphorylase [Dacryopinax primogenitus]
MARHSIIVPFSLAWGHLRPECGLAVNLVRRYTDLFISFLCEVDFVNRAKDEMSRQCLSEDERNSLLSRIRVIACGYPQPPMTPELFQMMMSMDPRDVHSPSRETCADANEMIDKVIDEQTFVDELGQEWGPVGAVPKVLICDVIMGGVAVPAKEKHNLSVFIWYIGSIASFTRSFAPPKHGGRGEGFADECEAIFADEERRNGRSFGDVVLDMWIRDHRVPGDIVRLAGMPPYFQWEDYPQQVWYSTMFNVLVGGSKLVDTADGFLLPTLEELENEGHKDLIQWARPRRVLCLGPQLPPALLSDAARASAEALAKLDVNFHASPAVDVSDPHGKHTSTVDTNGHGAVDPAIAFLDKTLTEYGPHSAIYISFGTLFFPGEEHMKILIETLLALEKPMPFVLAISSGRLSEDMKVAVEKSKRGLAVAWAPQQPMLSHPGLGWMITHCGGGGTFESLSSGVPVIAWPFIGDQPQHALLVSQVLDTGFDLLQVRNGAPGMPALRGDIAAGGVPILGTEEAIKTELRETLERAQGKDGARKRENAQKVKEVILNAVKQGGSAHKALGELDLLL